MSARARSVCATRPFLIESNVLAIDGAVLATFVSEDLTCFVAGGLASRGRSVAGAAVLSCAAGIYLGDLALWVVGRMFAAHVLAWPRVRSVLPVTRVDQFASWFEGHTAGVILGSRFAPGTRLPLYIAAGACGVSFSTFARWTFVAVAIWAPALVLASAVADDQVVSRLGTWLALGRYGALAIAVGALVVWRIGMRQLSVRARQRTAAAVSKIWRWEFWPMWLFYAPIGLWTIGLAIRYGGFRTLTAANPGIADGGVVGESKFDILERLPRGGRFRRR